MKFEDLNPVRCVLQLKKPEKTQFLYELKKFSFSDAKALVQPKIRSPFKEHPALRKARSVGVSQMVVMEIARWVLYNEEWKQFSFTLLQ